MATIYFSYQGESPTCFGNSSQPAVVGDTIQLGLDAAKYPNLSVNPIPAVIQELVENCAVFNPHTNTVAPGYDYTLNINEAFLPQVNGNPITDLDACDVIDITCAGCCEDHEVRLRILENAGNNPPRTRFGQSGVVGEVPDFGVPPVESDTAIIMNPEHDLEFWTYTGGVWVLNFTTHYNFVNFVNANDFV